MVMKECRFLMPTNEPAYILDDNKNLEIVETGWATFVIQEVTEQKMFCLELLLRLPRKSKVGYLIYVTGVDVEETRYCLEQISLFATKHIKWKNSRSDELVAELYESARQKYAGLPKVTINTENQPDKSYESASGRETLELLGRYFDLDQKVKHECDLEYFKVTKAPSTTTKSIKNLVIHWNDIHKFSREEIADRLEALDADIELRPQKV